MEDEGYVDDDFIAETARDCVLRHGNASIPLLEDLAEAAERAGDAPSAQTWRAIIELVERMIGPLSCG